LESKALALGCPKLKLWTPINMPDNLWFSTYLYDQNDQPVNTSAFLTADCQAGGSDGSDGCLGQENPSTNTSDTWLIPTQLAAGSYKIKVAVWNNSSQSAGALSEAFTFGSQSDIIIDFGTQYGIWLRLNNSTWVQLHTLSPEFMVTGNLDGIALESDTAISHQAPAGEDNTMLLPEPIAMPLPKDEAATELQSVEGQ